ncbi:terminase large subunit domain-containing protein, partial [Rhodoplanes elegans]|uniref:terminase large subunit domain-containing protein n=1 Tax=Rhodoplanes elegans TaxID=29408 RepID=UPI001911BFAB
GESLPAVLLPYQRELLAATSKTQLVVVDKSRRIGATWGIGADAVLTAGAQKSAGGMDVLYLGYNLDMAREFIDTCAMWARAFSPACSAVQEFLFHEQDERGADRAIQAFRISFASGFEIVALSSRPRSLRGRQGYVILDEFAFHDEADELLKAAIALLIWGGKVLVISTHNGVDNPFNTLIQEIRERRRPGAVVRCTFDDALEQGLYQRICLVTGKAWSPEAEATFRADIRGFYGAGAAEELDCIPAQGSGVYLTGALIEACMTATAPVLRLTCPKGFELKPDAERASFVDAWIEDALAPVLAALDVRIRHGYGWDFARSGDLSVMVPLSEGRDLVRRTPFVIELRNVPFREQERILFHVVDRLPRFGAGKHDARGNGQALAEYAVQRYGALAIEAVMPSQPWYIANVPPLKRRFEDRTIAIPRDGDHKDDLRQIRMVRGVPKVPDDAHTTGADGGQRHGDYAIALVLANAAMDSEVGAYGYVPASALADDSDAWLDQVVADETGGRALW